MTVNDPIADLLATIRNGQNARLAQVKCPSSRLRREVVRVLEEEGYISGYSEENVRKGISQLIIRLKYVDGQGVIRESKKVSKPGLRVYAPLRGFQKFYNGLGIAILSTSKGVMSDHHARQKNVGGEVLCYVF